MNMSSPAPSNSSPANISASSRDRDSCPTSTLEIPLGVVYSVICILGFAGNLVALWAFFSVKSKKNSMRVFLLNLVFADLLLVICLPFRIAYHTHENTWNMNPILCTVVSCLFYTNMYISIILLGLISVDRYLKINRSTGMQRRLMSPQVTRVLCAAVWIGVSAFTFSVYWPNQSNQLNPDHRCFHYKSLQSEKWKAYINMLALVIFWIVFIALMVSYGKIALKLQKRSQARPDLPNAPHYASSAKKSFFILFVFTFCFVPYHLFRVFYIVTQITEIHCFWVDVADKANEVALLFTASNSCLDPVMYFLLSSTVRKEMLRMAHSVIRLRDVGNISGSTVSDEKSEKIESVQLNTKT